MENWSGCNFESAGSNHDVVRVREFNFTFYVVQSVLYKRLIPEVGVFFNGSLDINPVALREMSELQKFK